MSFWKMYPFKCLIPPFEQLIYGRKNSNFHLIYDSIISCLTLHWNDSKRVVANPIEALAKQKRLLQQYPRVRFFPNNFEIECNTVPFS